MKKTLWKWEFYGGIIVFAWMIVLHYAYEKTGIRPLAFVSAVNESVWEHAKIGFYAALIYGIIEYIAVGRKWRNFLTAKGVAIVFVPVFIIVVFYTYTGIIGTHYLWVDIGIALAAAIISQVISYRLTTDPRYLGTYGFLWIIVIILLIVIFSIYTFDPPQLPLFYDRSAKQYGI